MIKGLFISIDKSDAKNDSFGCDSNGFDDLIGLFRG